LLHLPFLGFALFMIEYYKSQSVQSPCLILKTWNEIIIYWFK
jgi:hypothetical protein